MKKAKSHNIISVKDACTILTPNAYAKMGNQFICSLYIHVAASYKPGMELYNISQSQPLINGLAIYPKDGFDLEYLYTVFSSNFAVSMLLQGNLSKAKKITVKALNSLKIAKLDIRQQEAIRFLGDMNRDLLKSIRRGDLSPYLEFQQKQISELIDSIYIESLLPSIMEEYKIEILKNWMQMYEETFDNQEYISTELLYRLITESFLVPSNPVINNMKKLRIVLDVVIKEISKQS